MIRRRLSNMAAREEEGMSREWQTIVDTVTAEELAGSGNAFVFTAMPDGTPIQGHGFREIAIYYKYNANSEGTTSGYIKPVIKDINGASASVQLTAGIPATGYRRGYFDIVLGDSFSICNAQASTNTTMAQAVFYDYLGPVDEVQQIQMLTYADVGAGSEIKIMGR